MKAVSYVYVCTAGLSAGKGYVDVSTIDPATAAAVAAAVRGTGALYLEAPVSGSKGPAEQGTLIFLTAGKCGVIRSRSLIGSWVGSWWGP
jgi:glyoxylate/succinic semialdehyde reductase